MSFPRFLITYNKKEKELWILKNQQGEYLDHFTEILFGCGQTVSFLDLKESKARELNDKEYQALFINSSIKDFYLLP